MHLYSRQSAIITFMLKQKCYKNWRSTWIKWLRWFTGGFATSLALNARTGCITTYSNQCLNPISIQADHPIDDNRPDIVILYKETRKFLIIDVVCSFDTRIGCKEKEKMEKYHDLKRELKRIWKCKDVRIIPVIIILGPRYPPKRSGDMAWRAWYG